jgi:hypothetical protein
LVFDKNQERTLSVLPLLRDCLKQWRLHDSLAPQDDAQAGARVADCLNRAREHGLMDERDQVAMTLHELLIHPDICQHPDIKNAIVLAKGGEGYRHVTAGWPAARWESIQTQLTNREMTSYERDSEHQRSGGSCYCKRFQSK